MPPGRSGVEQVFAVVGFGVKLILFLELPVGGGGASARRRRIPTQEVCAAESLQAQDCQRQGEGQDAARQ